MKWRTFEIQREPGFRLNLTDIFFILFLCLLAALSVVYLPSVEIHWLVLYLGLSFFLFCNLFRIGNRLEIFWYVPFAAFAAYALYSENLAWFWRVALPVLEIIKWGLIIYRIRRGPYLGIGYEKLARYSLKRPLHG
jgi:hypothetical protein